ncbi:UDP-2,3-diacylglucosamine diphosphatase [Halalkalibaculum sp. DA3122]|uniref:UDP-2,3-diacylglucosamine diphosphatase n=1 Tax=unclassified Halalkalibaculum TaxID=2964617 RepID=UPI0037553B30
MQPPETAARPLLFLSDVHLGGFAENENRELERQLIRLIDHCQSNGIKIFILGDLFDYWMEFPGHVPELGKKVNERFREYNNELGPTLYITGNHDNWTRSYFEEIGFTLEPEYKTLKIRGRNLLLLHGDGIPNESGELLRPPLHRLLRNKTFISFYQTLLAPRAGLWVMKWFSRLNRRFGSLREDESTLNRWGRQNLKTTNTDIIICGHDHLPRKKEFNFGTFLNLGTFYKHRTMALYNNEGLNIVVWNDASRQLNNFYTAENQHE